MNNCYNITSLKIKKVISFAMISELEKSFFSIDIKKSNKKDTYDFKEINVVLFEHLMPAKTISIIFDEDIFLIETKIDYNCNVFEEKKSIIEEELLVYEKLAYFFKMALLNQNIFITFSSTSNLKLLLKKIYSLGIDVNCSYFDIHKNFYQYYEFFLDRIIEYNKKCNIHYCCESSFLFKIGFCRKIINIKKFFTNIDDLVDIIDEGKIFFEYPFRKAVLIGFLINHDSCYFSKYYSYLGNRL